MDEYFYRAIDPEGKKVTGSLYAINIDDLEARLKINRLIVIDVAIRYRAAMKLSCRIYRSTKKFRRELINFFFQLEQLIRAGIPILDVLEDLAAGSENPFWRGVLSRLCHSILNGGTLSQACAAQPQVFDVVLINLIAAGELGGNLPAVLSSVTEHLRWQDELRSETRRLMLYPMIAGGFIFLSTVFLMAYLVPELKTFLSLTGQALPIYSKILFSLSDWISVYYLWLVMAGAFIIMTPVFLLKYSDRCVFLFDRYRFMIPVYGSIEKKIIIARLSDTLALLYSSGVSILDSIRMLRHISGNRFVLKALDDALEKINEGSIVSQAFADTRFFPVLMVRMLQVGEQTGRLDQSLNQVGYFYHRDVREETARAQAMMLPFMTIILGAFLGWLMMSVFGPLYGLLGKISL